MATQRRKLTSVCYEHYELLLDFSLVLFLFLFIFN